MSRPSKPSSACVSRERRREMPFHSNNVIGCWFSNDGFIGIRRDIRTISPFLCVGLHNWGLRIVGDLLTNYSAGNVRPFKLVRVGSGCLVGPPGDYV